MLRLDWIQNGFITKELYAPFIIDKDADYYDVLREKYKILLQQAEKSGADENSQRFIQNYSKRICNAVLDYYKGHITTANRRIKNIVAECIDHNYAVSPLAVNQAFRGVKNTELQLYRGRISDKAIPYTLKSKI